MIPQFIEIDCNNAINIRLELKSFCLFCLLISLGPIAVRKSLGFFTAKPYGIIDLYVES